MKLNERVKNILFFFLRFGLSAALLIYLFKKIDIEKTLSVLRGADLGYIYFGGATFLFIHAIILIRWKIFIDALGLKVSVLNMIRYFFIGLFGNLFLPSSIGGDVIKIYGLCKDSSQKPKVVASVLLDRLSGFGGMMVLALVSFVLGFKMINDFSLLISICILAIIVIGLATILFNEKVYSFCCQIFNKFPKFKNALMNMHYDIALLKGNRLAVVQAVLVSSLAQIVLAVTFFIVAKALLQDIAFIYFLIFVPLICVASSLPSIGGLGVREAGAAYLFAKVGVDSGIAVSISLINFFYMVLVGLLGGAIYVLTLSSGRIQHHQTNELGRQKA